MSLLRRATDFLLQNRLQAIAVAFVLAYVPLIGSISILIAGLVTLRKGALEGAYVLIAATLPYLLSYYANPTINIALIAMVIIVISNILVWVFAIVLKKYGNWSLILEYGFLLSILIVGIIHILYPDVQQWWKKELVSYFAKSTAIVSNLPGNDNPTEAALQMADGIKRYTTGLVIISVLFNAYLQLLIARWWQAVIFNPGGLRKELYAVRFSHFIGIIFIICIVFNYLQNETVMDMVPIAYAIFSVAGLSLIHCTLAKKPKTAWVWLMLIYVTTVLLFPISLMVISILALFDTWMNFRKRLKLV